MKRNVLFAALAGLILLAATTAHAQRQGRGFGAPPFLKADTNGDGVITAAEWSALFKTLDADHNGKLEGAELPGPRHGAPPQGAAAYLLSHGADADGDGQVTLDEFRAHIAKLDADGDGALSAEELPLHPFRGPGGAGAPAKRALGGLPPFLAAADTDHDGKLELAELEAAFNQAAAEHDGVLPVHGFRGQR